VRLWVRSDSQHSSPLRFPDEVIRSLVFYVTAPVKSKQFVMHGYFLKGTIQEEGGSNHYLKCKRRKGNINYWAGDHYWYKVDLAMMIETVKNAKKEEIEDRCEVGKEAESSKLLR
jgi:hypothetical protein